MKFKRMNRVSISDEIIEHIKDLIINKTLKPDERLPSEEKMALQMAVGRGTIREAIKVLVYLGFIERKNKGTFVSSHVMDRIIPKDVIGKFKRHRNIMEMIEVRKIIEPESAGLAAGRANPKEVAEIENQYRLMLDSKDNIEVFIDHDNSFHSYIIKATRNNILIEIMKNIQKLMMENQALVLKKSKNIMPRSLEFHGKILKAIQDGKEDLARNYMLKHILDIEKEMYLILRQKED